MGLLPDRTMSRTWSVTACALSATCILLAHPLPAVAALGGDETSIETDRVHMQAALLQVTPTEAYTVHAIQTASGTTVREAQRLYWGKLYRGGLGKPLGRGEGGHSFI